MNIECPAPVETADRICLAHGSGGELSQRLLHKYIYPHFKNPWLERPHDSAILPLDGGKLAFTTDSFVVSPLFFPGGNIGELAVYGTVNDLAMSGARPLYLSCSLILEEGLPLRALDRIMASMGCAAAEVGVQLVTGDTKVVERGKGDGLYINTAGVGRVACKEHIAPECIETGDVILLSGDIGRHGMAVMAKREGLEFDSPLQSDCAPLHEPVLDLLAAGISVHCLRDLTRGGLATALIELATASGRQMTLQEPEIPVGEAVQGACELLGIDPLYVANEGRFIAVVPVEQEAQALAILKRHTVSAGACAIGRVGVSGHSSLILQNMLGCERVLDFLPGEQLPRIC
ncbi:hydrogenase expression/formation protein HypE [Microbulbifer aggregans]|uniref:hydrogenase expression/formation protein HypE n=1 Tax=Microbulbifer aggregans TaxID=1769779 RepID=UPI001CFE8556|nr:hydrogenase expression/formation protein HypE [Microbulbifer aggregans]